MPDGGAEWYAATPGGEAIRGELGGAARAGLDEAAAEVAERFGEVS
ncbi:hypothetical protein [Streptomyces incarnatus]|nr:hypothetical protein [Streptomyces incarnatus]